MLPQTKWINKAVEEQLPPPKRKNRRHTKHSRAYRIFRSIEKGFIFNKEKDYKLSGSLKLDKFTWLGKIQMVTELLLKKRYPEYSDEELQTAWAAHIEDGIARIRNLNNINHFIREII